MVVKLIVLILVFTAIAIPLHELGHYAVLKLLGGDGVLEYHVFWAKIIVTKNPSNWLPVLLAGGLITSAVFGIIAILNKNLETRFASTLISVQQLLYGLTEAFITKYIWLMGIVSTIIAIILTFLIIYYTRQVKTK